MLQLVGDVPDALPVPPVLIPHGPQSLTVFISLPHSHGSPIQAVEVLVAPAGPDGAPRLEDDEAWIVPTKVIVDGEAVGDTTGWIMPTRRQRLGIAAVPAGVCALLQSGRPFCHFQVT